MDSLTHILLGGSLAAACVPAAHRRRAVAVGAVLATLPDLDVIKLALMGADPVSNMVLHRGYTHSLLVLGGFGLALWALLRRVWAPVREHPGRWLWAILLPLSTHAVLDALTVYGTQLWWPLPASPVMWSSLFIIDPLYTLPLLVGVLAALAGGVRPWARTAVMAGLVLSTAYIGWSLTAKGIVERAVARTLSGTELADAPRFSVPMPFNTLLWRVVVMTPEGYLEGQYSVVADRGPVRLEAHPSEVQALAAVADFQAVRQLKWFNRGFMRARVQDERLVLSDLRMGLEPHYTFNFAVAERVDGAWVQIEPEQIRWRREDVGGQLGAMWRRIWTSPDAAEGG